MTERNLSLSPRVEDVRDKNPIRPVVKFTLSEIKERFDNTISNIESQFAISDSLLSQGETVSSQDILRSQVVFAESALDFYIHEISKIAFVNIFTDEWSKTDKYLNFLIPMKFVDRGIKNPESTDWLLEYLNQRFSREVYLSTESMREQLNMLNLDFTSIVSKSFPPLPGENDNDAFKRGKKIISDLFSRRNAIAHQSDREHSNAERNPISKEYVQQCIDDVKALANAIQACAESLAV